MLLDEVFDAKGPIRATSIAALAVENPAAHASSFEALVALDTVQLRMVWRGVLWLVGRLERGLPIAISGQFRFQDFREDSGRCLRAL